MCCELLIAIQELKDFNPATHGNPNKYFASQSEPNLKRFPGKKIEPHLGTPATIESHSSTLAQSKPAGSEMPTNQAERENVFGTSEPSNYMSQLLPHPHAQTQQLPQTQFQQMPPSQTQFQQMPPSQQRNQPLLPPSNYISQPSPPHALTKIFPPSQAQNFHSVISQSTTHGYSSGMPPQRQNEPNPNNFSVAAQPSSAYNHPHRYPQDPHSNPSMNMHSQAGRDLPSGVPFQSMQNQHIGLNPPSGAGEWSCPHCTFKNSTRYRVCEACDRTPDFKVDQPSAQSMQPQPHKKLCPRCNRMNRMRKHNVDTVVHHLCDCKHVYYISKTFPCLDF